MQKQFAIAATFVFLIQVCCFAQRAQYDSIVKIANRYFDNADYKNAVIEYIDAFEALGHKAFAEDQYKAAQAWGMIGIRDSAFYHLNRLFDYTDYLEYPKLINGKEFYKLHNDARWETLLTKLNPNNEIYHDSLARVLSVIHENDQKYRLQLDSFESKYGYTSNEYQGLWKTINMHDSINLQLVVGMLDKYGWLSKNEVGGEGNTTLWLVIQHASLEVQEKYCPMMELAVTAGKASKMNLAYLQDRILMREGKKQLYGTQYNHDSKTNITKLYDVEDPDNLNKRRELMGLPAMTIEK